MYKAIPTSVLSVEPGNIVHRGTSNVEVNTEPLSTIKRVDRRRDCIVMSLSSGANGSITDHVLNINNAEDLFISLLGALCAVANPIALTLRDSLPLTIEDIPLQYRS